MQTREGHFVGREESTKSTWEPMTMTLVGTVAALVQGGAMGSRGDGGVSKKV